MSEEQKGDLAQRSSAQPVAWRWHYTGERAWTLVHSNPGSVAGTIVEPLYLACPSPAASEDARAEVDVLRAEASAMSREYALASMAIGRRGDEKISLSEQIKQLRAQVEGARNSETIPVPKAALDWLFGEGKDSDGWGFGECRTAQLALNAKNPRRYWWRSKFRAMIPALRLSNTPQDGASK